MAVGVVQPGALVPAGAIDLSATYTSVFDEVLAHATLVAGPFHVIKRANAKVDECRRRVQNEALGHRGRTADLSTRCDGY